MIVSCWTLPLLDDFFGGGELIFCGFFALILPFVLTKGIISGQKLDFPAIYAEFAYEQSKTNERCLATYHACHLQVLLKIYPKFSSKRFFILKVSSSLLMGYISHHQLSSNHLKPRTHLMGSQAASKVAFQMGSGDWFTLSQWRWTWLHDQMVAPWFC